MNESDREFLLSELKRSRAALLGSLEGIPSGQAAWRPAENVWSILDRVEHVAHAESMLVRGIRRGKPLEMAAGPSELEQAILAKGARRSRRFEAPEAARPGMPR